MFRLFIFTLVSGLVYSSEIKQRLAVPPPDLPGFNVHAYLGRWFVQFRRAPCTWPGSTMFTDYTQNVVPDGQGAYHNHLTWRSNGVCNKVTGIYMLTPPGVFTVKDNIGDSFSGTLKVVAIDYKHFVVYWGCTRISVVSGRCDDPWISVATRLQYPSPAVIGMIERYLRTIGISLGELAKVPHQAPCQPHHYGVCK